MWIVAPDDWRVEIHNFIAQWCFANCWVWTRIKSSDGNYVAWRIEPVVWHDRLQDSVKILLDWLKAAGGGILIGVDVGTTNPFKLPILGALWSVEQLWSSRFAGLWVITND